MRARLLLLAGTAALLTGCGQSGEPNATAANGAANAAAATVKHPTYCFFKDADTRGWSAARDAQGNVTIKGQAHIDDNRYTAQLGEPEISGTNASLWLTMGTNTGATGAPENWWDVKAVIPGSTAVDAVTVMCGKKTVAQLKVAAAG